jgi:tripartite-type tricarboxylate transporter receptor subunit TctC
MELFKQMAGVNIVHVPYKAAPQAVTDVLAGNIQMMFNSVAPVLPHVKSERVRALGIASPKRSPQLPDIPAIAETVPGYESENWFGVFARRTPKRIITLVNDAQEGRALAGDLGSVRGAGRRSRGRHSRS